MKRFKVRILRNTRVQGAAAPAGAVLEVDEKAMMALLGAKKAQMVEEAEEPTAEKDAKGEAEAKPKRKTRRKTSGD